MKNLPSILILLFGFFFNGSVNARFYIEKNLLDSVTNPTVSIVEDAQEEKEVQEVQSKPLIPEVVMKKEATTKPDGIFKFEDLSMPYENHRVYCDPVYSKDGNPLTTFIDDWGFCVPSLVTNETWFTPSPEYVYGTAVYYAPGVMEGTARWRGMYNTAYKSDDYIGGVAVPSPANIGDTVWLRRPDSTWEGPFLVVDCSRRADMYSHIIYNQQVVEVDFRTALEWELVTTDWKVKDTGRLVWSSLKGKEPLVEVYYGKDRPSEDILLTRKPIYFADYWYNSVVKLMTDHIEPSPWITVFGINPVWDLRNGQGEKCFTMECRGE